MTSSAYATLDADVAHTVEVLKIALADYNGSHKSKHWDVFPENYVERISDASVWEDFRYNNLTAGFDVGWSDPSKSGKPAVIDDHSEPRAQPILRRYRSLLSITGPEFISEFVEAEIGNPERLYIDGVALNTTDLRLLHDAWDISQWFVDRNAPKRSVEIGGGFGGLTGKIRSLYPDCQCIILDLPEVNAVQSIYYRMRFPNIRLLDYAAFKERGPECLLNTDWDIALLPGWCAVDVADQSIDLIVNTRSFMEMTNDTVAFYFRELQRFSRVSGFFYCVNRYWKATAGEPVLLKHFPFDARWVFSLSAMAWDQDWLHRLGAVRLDFDSAISPKEQIRNLPPSSLRDTWDNLKFFFRGIIRLTLGGHRNIEPGLNRYLFLTRRYLERLAVSVIKRLIGRS